MSSRHIILKNIKAACDTIKTSEPMPDFTDHQPQLSHEQQIERFIEKANKAQAKVYDLNWQQFNDQLPFMCEKFNINELYCAESLKQKIPYNRLFSDTLTDNLNVVAEGAALVEARYGLFETGTVICCSNDQSANALFLPQHLFVVLSAEHLVWDITTACDKLKQQNIWPRMINCITGPSCTADIEQTLLYGAHGPKTLSIFLIRS